jgi:hypothetical protein
MKYSTKKINNILDKYKITDDIVSPNKIGIILCAQNGFNTMYFDIIKNKIYFRQIVKEIDYKEEDDQDVITYVYNFLIDKGCSLVNKDSKYIKNQYSKYSVIKKINNF